MEQIMDIQGDKGFLNRVKNSMPLFILVSGYTKTAEIPGITVAGLPGLIDYTPALDMEILYYGYPKSMPEIAKMPDGPPSPVLITAAVKELMGFPVMFIDVGLRIKPKTPITLIDSSVSESISDGSNVNAEFLFEEGVMLAKHIRSFNKTIVLSECVPAGTTTAYAVTKALGYNCDHHFSSSNFDKKTYELKRKIVDDALMKHKSKINTPFGAMTHVGDAMQPFLSGMANELSQRDETILAGGTQMAAIYAILKAVGKGVNFDNLSLFTTKWIVEDKHSSIKDLLKLIDPKLNAFYADFDFKDSQYKNLRLYDEGFVKEGVGAGALLCSAYLNGINKKDILSEVEKIYSAFA